MSKEKPTYITIYNYQKNCLFLPLLTPKKNWNPWKAKNMKKRESNWSIYVYPRDSSLMDSPSFTMTSCLLQLRVVKAAAKRGYSEGWMLANKGMLWIRLNPWWKSSASKSSTVAQNGKCLHMEVLATCTSASRYIQYYCILHGFHILYVLFHICL